MKNFGIVEGFFGPEWSREARLSFPVFLKNAGGGFYIYAPKRDAHLRKVWRESWDKNYLTELVLMRDVFQNEGIEFGVALSPFGLGVNPSKDDLSLLRQRLKVLSDLKIDRLGLFFDDMPSTENLLNVQSMVVQLALEYFPKGLIFCPSYYTYDPILDKVFGARPAGYVEGLKEKIHSSVDICWTGPKVISEEITEAHLDEVRTLLGRKPFIWENLYANDGPRNCKFLKLKYMQGRDNSFVTKTAGVAMNLMNQPYLSQILYLASVYVVRDGLEGQNAFEKSCETLLNSSTADFILQHRERFLKDGLDNIEAPDRQQLLRNLEHHYDAAAYEIAAWLKGEYLVGPECLTD